ncbi:ankyrin repeat-containing domain protein [Jimgerdemannia flammicorona]|uniref:Ankyrin repeat-containing domain protein n=1 Tax=Jimgerdemannia flammicorona TaxID=994334 RepID=A0A433DG93_9FUNG|nr:ankyrin repeat-containing domain protein [Jimgerdemannia flammicorona]
MKLPHKIVIWSGWPSGGLYETTSRNSRFLYFAYVASNIGKVKRLASPRNVNSKFDVGFSLLHFAARHGSVEIIELFCGLGVLVDAQNDCGEMPLYYANRSDVVKCLIKFGADVNVQDIENRTPLHNMLTNSEVVDALLNVPNINMNL